MYETASEGSASRVGWYVCYTLHPTLYHIPGMHSIPRSRLGWILGVVRASEYPPPPGKLGMGVVMGVRTNLLSVLLPRAKYFIPHGHLPVERCTRPRNYRTAPPIAPAAEKAQIPYTIHGGVHQLHTAQSTANWPYRYRCRCRYTVEYLLHSTQTHPSHREPSPASPRS